MKSNSLNNWLVTPAVVVAMAVSSWAFSSENDHSMHEHMMQDHAADKHSMHNMSDDHSMHDMKGMKGMSAEEHAAHRAMMQKKDYKVSEESYTVPGLELLDRSGKSVKLQSLLGGDQPVALNFIFTTCTTVCPIMSATFAQMRRDLGSEADRIQLVSITIDPEHDSPKVLAEYAKRYDAPASWHFLTGKPKDIETVRRAFDSWTGTKTNHQPITLLRGKGEEKWIRVDGLASGSSLAKQARTVLNEVAKK